MKNLATRVMVVSFAVLASRCPAESSGSPIFLQTVAHADVVGIGRCEGNAGSHSTRIHDIIYWFGDLGTNSVALTPFDLCDDGRLLPDVGTNDTVVFFGIRKDWNPFLSNAVFRIKPMSAWELREKFVQAGSAEHIPDPPFQFPGAWINVTTSSPSTITFISNVVQSLCVSPDLIQYSEALIPPLKIGWESELFMFKADAFEEMLKLEWGENEDFLVHVLNSPQYTAQMRGSALFQLEKRFDWPATNTVPVP